MGLTIEGAKIGYDRSQMVNTLNHVHNNCVLHAQRQLRANLTNLRAEVRKCWAGQSAENFMDNMDHDVDEICKGLEKAYQGLEGEFKKVLAGLAGIDRNLIKKR